MEIPGNGVELLVAHYSTDGVNITYEEIKDIFSPADASKRRFLLLRPLLALNPDPCKAFCLSTYLLFKRVISTLLENEEKAEYFR